MGSVDLFYYFIFHSSLTFASIFFAMSDSDHFNEISSYNLIRSTCLNEKE